MLLRAENQSLKFAERVAEPEQSYITHSGHYDSGSSLCSTLLIQARNDGSSCKVSRNGSQGMNWPIIKPVKTHHASYY